MVSDTSRPRSEISQLVIQLRSALGLTQQQFASLTEVALTSVARWETLYPPRAKRIEQLAVLAEENGLPGIARQFRGSFRRVTAAEILNEVEEARVYADNLYHEQDEYHKRETWNGLTEVLMRIHQIATRLDQKAKTKQKGTQKKK